MLAFNHIGHLGRLGNQMFQYASLRGIAARRGYDFGIPDSNFSDEWRTHQLFEVFDLVHLPKQNIRFLDGGNAPVASEKHFHFDQQLLISAQMKFLSLDFSNPKNISNILRKVSEKTLHLEVTSKNHVMK